MNYKEVCSYDASKENYYGTYFSECIAWGFRSRRE